MPAASTSTSPSVSAEHASARARCPFRPLGVQRVGQRHVDGVDVRRLDQRGVVLDPGIDAVGRGEPLTICTIL
jgi:hypothetical protein